MPVSAISNTIKLIEACWQFYLVIWLRVQSILHWIGQFQNRWHGLMKCQTVSSIYRLHLFFALIPWNASGEIKFCKVNNKQCLTGQFHHNSIDGVTIWRVFGPSSQLESANYCIESSSIGEFDLFRSFLSEFHRWDKCKQWFFIRALCWRFLLYSIQFVES